MKISYKNNWKSLLHYFEHIWKKYTTDFLDTKKLYIPIFHDKAVDLINNIFICRWLVQLMEKKKKEFHNFYSKINNTRDISNFVYNGVFQKIVDLNLNRLLERVKVSIIRNKITILIKEVVEKVCLHRKVIEITPIVNFTKFKHFFDNLSTYNNNTCV